MHWDWFSFIKVGMMMMEGAAVEVRMMVTTVVTISEASIVHLVTWRGVFSR